MGEKRTPRKKRVRDDSLNKKIIKELSEELGISKKKVKFAINHFFGWQREAFDNLDYESYLWRYFGTFKILPRRYEKYKNNLTKKTSNNNNNNNNSNDKIEKKSSDEDKGKEG